VAAASCESHASSRLHLASKRRSGARVRAATPAVQSASHASITLSACTAVRVLLPGGPTSAAQSIALGDWLRDSGVAGQRLLAAHDGRCTMPAEETQTPPSVAPKQPRRARQHGGGQPDGDVEWHEAGESDGGRKKRAARRPKRGGSPS